MDTIIQIINAIFDGIHKLARPAILGGLVYAISTTAVDSPAFAALIALATAAIQSYFEKKGQGK